MKSRMAREAEMKDCCTKRSTVLKSASRRAILEALRMACSPLDLDKLPIIIQGCIQIDGNLEINIPINSTMTLFNYSCSQGDKFNTVKFKDKNCHDITTKYDTLAISLIVTPGTDCNVDQNVQGLNLRLVIPLSVIAALVIILLIIVLMVPSLRERIFPFSSRQRYIREPVNIEMTEKPKHN